jgi:hypothetical protein
MSVAVLYTAKYSAKQATSSTLPLPPRQVPDAAPPAGRPPLPAKTRNRWRILGFIGMMKTNLVCLIIPASHLNAFAQVVPKGTQFKPVYGNGRWGYIDRAERFAIAPQFREAHPFAGGLAQVSTAVGKKQLIDTSRKVIRRL